MVVQWGDDVSMWSYHGHSLTITGHKAIRMTALNTLNIGKTVSVMTYAFQCYGPG